MAWILEVATVDPGDGTVKVVHRFYGETKEECDTYLSEHLDFCEYFDENTSEGGSYERYVEGPLLSARDLKTGGWEQVELDDEEDKEPDEEDEDEESEEAQT